MRISDWSSDVCSSDLELHDIDPRPENRMDQKGVATKSISRIVDADMLDEVPKVDKVSMEKARWLRSQELPQDCCGSDGPVATFQIGRASCRERVCRYV